jgi:hypothetical protein
MYTLLVSFETQKKSASIMSDIPITDEDRDPSFGPLMRSLAIEAIFYIPLAIGYFLLFRTFLNKPLHDLYTELPVGIVQGILLEVVTSWLLRRIGLRN